MIELLDFKSLNLFKFQINIENSSAFLIIIKLEYYICQISKF